MHEVCCPKLLLKDGCTIHFRHVHIFCFLSMVDSERAKGILEEPMFTLIPSEDYSKVIYGTGEREATFPIPDT